jgi:shikimate 5-dehydrogenase
MGVFADFQKTHNIPDAQIMGVSRAIEKHEPEDRTLLLKRYQARKAEKKYDDESINAAKKPRSGRGVSVQALIKARSDIPLPRKVRSKITKAVNTILKRRGKPEAKITDIFGKVTVTVGKTPVKKKK